MMPIPSCLKCGAVASYCIDNKYEEYKCEACHSHERPVKNTCLTCKYFNTDDGNRCTSRNGYNLSCEHYVAPEKKKPIPQAPKQAPAPKPDNTVTSTRKIYWKKKVE